MGKERSNDATEFEVNGVKCGYDGVLVWAKNENGEEIDIASFEDINLLEKTAHSAIFYSECLDKYLDGYLHFNGKVFSEINKIDFEVVPAHHEDDMPQMPEMYEQVRTIIDDCDIINQVIFDNDHHWGIESSSFLFQKNNYYKGKMLLGICTCTSPGCSDVVAEIDSSENYVSWKIYLARGDTSMNKIFVFKKTDYQNALEKAKNNITQEEKDNGWLSFL
jgi:hypothetical protein